MNDRSAPILNRTGIEILAISFVILFQELALIRWLSGQVRVLAYFPNLILISAFLGLGLGCLRANRASLAWLWPTSLLIVVAVAYALSHVAFTQGSTSEHLWLLYADLPQDAPMIDSVRPPIIVLFMLSAISFVPLGQLLADRLETFRRISDPLWGYSWDLLGSMLGVVAFAVAGFLGLFPWSWFAVALVIGLLFFGLRGRVFWGTLAVAIAVPAMIHETERASWYSPYYAISKATSPDSLGFRVLTNGSFHQQAVPLHSGGHDDNPGLARVRSGYHAPFEHLQDVPKRALVVGAGTGNDISVLLAEGVGRIDAVEIDPVILELGRDHPDQPYASDRVRVINTDARSFFNNSTNRYDLIVFGTLDSMTRLSALSNVRLDNFVYTRDAIEAARGLLADDGGMVLYFMVSTPYIHQRLAGLLASVFDRLPIIHRGNFFLFNTIFMIGPAFDHVDPVERADPAFFSHVLPTIELPSDDWPYLYLEQRGISAFYLSLIAVLVAVAFLGVFLVSPDMRRSLRSRRKIDLEMFCYGAAFLLMEATFVTAMNLIWGATWLTSAVVFGSVLAMILVATVCVALRPIPWPAASLGLVISLAIAYAIPLKSLLVDSVGLKLALSFLYVGLPIFFAGACFALRFRTRKSPGVAFGWNLLGAVTGGLLEFLSMAVGLAALVLLALLLYLTAFLLQYRARPGTASPDAA